jgi:uncharacterized RDD family membrane protein YckC
VAADPGAYARSVRRRGDTREEDAMEPTPSEKPTAGPEAPAPPQAPAPPPQAPAPQPAWMQSLTSTAPVAGPAGLFYADLLNRIIAYIIDIILLAIAGAVVGAITGSFMPVYSFDLVNGFHYNYLAAIINAVIGGGISAAYFIYTWTAMRGTVGMKVLGMQIGSEKDGATLSMDQGIRRWLAVGGWITIAQALNPLPLVGLLIGVVSLGYVIYLLYTTAQSPTKQGFHDHFVGSMVVKAARSVA